MFSCCRASSKNSNLPKKVYNKKFEALTQNRNGKGETADDQKRIIPTIKIEKGKTNNFNDENNSFSPNVKESENVLENYPAINTMCDDIAIDGATKSETTDIAANTQLGNENVGNDQSEVENKLYQTTTIDYNSTTTTTNEISSESCGKLVNIETAALKSNNETTASTTPVKSCLSRHNSMHISIKKKVNIRTQAEIIESDPVPQSPHDPVSSTVDDDDVFSDSLPPPKRESMCAPYIEQNEIPELVAYAHGLPEWFNDERINEM